MSPDVFVTYLPGRSEWKHLKWLPNDGPAGSSRQRDHGPYACMVEPRTEDAVQFRERELAGAVTRGGAFELPPVAKARDHAAHFGVRDIHEMEATEYGVDP